MLQMHLTETDFYSMKWIDLAQYQITGWAHVLSVVSLYALWQYKQLNNS
jgi:hypothetical protein